MAALPPHTPVAIVSGSGLTLRPLLDHVHRVTPFPAVLGPVCAGVEGHEGCFVEGELAGRPMILQCGRLHLYEGHDYRTVACTIDHLHGLGVRAVIFTNAAGGLRPEMLPGDLMAVQSVRTLAPYTVFPAWPDAPPQIDADFTVAGCDHKGDYLWVLGPNYETRAEIHAFRVLGAAAVGMSTAPEMQRCRELGLSNAAISCITNNCCTPQVLTHEHVLRVAQTASERAVGLLRRLLAE